MATFNYRFAAAGKAAESNSEYGIIADFSFGGTRLRINTSIKIKFKHFNPDYNGDLSKIVRSTISQEGINRAEKIHEFKVVHERLNKGLELFIGGHFPQCRNAKEAIDQYLVAGINKDENLIKKYSEFLEFKKKGVLKNQTLNTHTRVGEIIEDIVKKNTDLSFDAFNLSEDFFFAFLNYSIENEFASSTHNRYLMSIKTFLLWLQTKYTLRVVNRHYQVVKSLPEDRTIHFMNKEEILAFKKFKFSNIGQQREQDNFLFQMSIGCRDSEMRLFAKSLHYFDIETGMLKIINKKGKAILNIMLPAISKEIYEKYKEKGKFPVSANKTRNKHLREMFTLMKMHRIVQISRWSIRLNNYVVTQEKVCDVITTHWARSSFITNMSNDGMSNTVMLMFTGQTDRTLRRYQGKDPVAMRSAIENQINALFNK